MLYIRQLPIVDYFLKLWLKQKYLNAINWHTSPETCKPITAYPGIPITFCPRICVHLPILNTANLPCKHVDPSICGFLL